jgi:ferredoxin
LHFDTALVDKPIVSHVVKTYDVDLNILQARVTPAEDGMMFLIMSGTDAQLDDAVAYLQSVGVETVVTSKSLILNEEKCVHCGACVGQCLPKALSVDPRTRRVAYDGSACIACELCVPACPFGAIESVGARLNWKGAKANG